MSPPVRLLKTVRLLETLEYEVNSTKWSVRGLTHDSFPDIKDPGIYNA